MPNDDAFIGCSIQFSSFSSEVDILSFGVIKPVKPVGLGNVQYNLQRLDVLHGIFEVILFCCYFYWDVGYVPRFVCFVQETHCPSLQLFMLINTFPLVLTSRSQSACCSVSSSRPGKTGKLGENLEPKPSQRQLFLRNNNTFQRYRRL